MSPTSYQAAPPRVRLVQALYALSSVLQVCKHGAERGTRTLTPKALAPHASVSTNFTISALNSILARTFYCGISSLLLDGLDSLLSLACSMV